MKCEKNLGSITRGQGYSDGLGSVKDGCSDLPGGLAGTGTACSSLAFPIALILTFINQIDENDFSTIVFKHPGCNLHFEAVFVFLKHLSENPPAELKVQRQTFQRILESSSSCKGVWLVEWLLHKEQPGNDRGQTTYCSRTDSILQQLTGGRGFIQQEGPKQDSIKAIKYESSLEGEVTFGYREGREQPELRLGATWETSVGLARLEHTTSEGRGGE
ncbi:uncharacterized protein LOC129146805 [Talpa occidentalis]|uniref:uncharacterized protein LOC129146805 n=1 Tax=Talpa occidentalis TaxID=50954 RepID=UPI0023F888B8|nr:uncharacterized protein LOC129146805 [Talpa occidentalis]